MNGSGQMTSALVAALSEPASYPDDPGPVTVKETHMSWVFLTDAHAYKLKKPLYYSYLDFRSPQARRQNCEREVRLNRRFTRDVYQGVAAVSLAGSGRVRVGPPMARVEADDWLVVMRRLAETDTLESRLARGEVDAEALAAPVELLLAGYACRPRPDVAPYCYVNRLWRQAGANAAVLQQSRYGLDDQRPVAIAAALQRHLARYAERLAERVRRGLLVEGHGDLRPEHVYLTQPARIVDCLEFDRRLRILDPVDELACLGLHAAHPGAAWVRDALLAHYRRVTDDRPPSSLAGLYTASRGLLWAALAIRHLDRAPSDPDHWRARARAYLGLADTAVSEMD